MQVVIMGSSEDKPNVVVIMGPTGSGKSKLAIEIASHFSIEIINSDSMQVYRGLDILTNKVPFANQQGIPHHLLGTVNPNSDFTSTKFRDSAIPLINDIISRNKLPVIVGGTSFYMQALLCPFIVDDLSEKIEEIELNEHSEYDMDLGVRSAPSSSNYQRLKYIDPVAAKRIHPNDHRKINQYVMLHDNYGVIPSNSFKSKAAENWCRSDRFRYRCCFLCVDASLPALDQYVVERVDQMVESGLLGEVYEIHNSNADYTRGLHQAIGVKEFDEFMKMYFKYYGSKECDPEKESHMESSLHKSNHSFDSNNSKAIFLSASTPNQLKTLFKESINKVKSSTRRLIRRQKCRVKRLQTVFGWTINFVDSTETLNGNRENAWDEHVLKPSVEIIKSFLHSDTSLLVSQEKVIKKQDFWTQYTCEACDHRVLRGSHEWEQHLRGRRHRRRLSSLQNRNLNCRLPHTKVRGRCEGVVRVV